jgi:prolyl-tRNA editing enzyme YbaK/EbsC (Cys-tRNA(Pro) deacylase)
VRTSVDVHNFLIERGVQHELFSARGRFREPERIAEGLDLPAAQVAKVLVFEGRTGPVAAVVPIGSRVDLGRLRKATGQPSLEVAADDRSFELTDYLPESTPPAGLPAAFTTVVDRSLAHQDVLYSPGGEARAILKIRGKDLVKATRAKVSAIVAKGDTGAR